MPSFRHGELTIELDDKGYLVHAEDWTPDLATALAQSDGIAPLTRAYVRTIADTSPLRIKAVPRPDTLLMAGTPRERAAQVP